MAEKIASKATKNAGISRKTRKAVRKLATKAFFKTVKGINTKKAKKAPAPQPAAAPKPAPKPKKAKVKFVLKGG